MCIYQYLRRVILISESKRVAVPLPRQGGPLCRASGGTSKITCFRPHPEEPMCCDYSSGGGWAERSSRGSSENLASPSIEDAPHRVVVLPPEKGSKPGTVLDLENQIKAITIDPSKSSSVDCRRVMKPESLDVLHGLCGRN